MPLVDQNTLCKSIELAVKGPLDETTSNECATIYSSNFALLKNSGKMKGEIKAAAQILNMEYCALSKLTGTHFVGHCWNAYMPTPLWSSVTMAYENFITDENARPDTKSDRLLDKLKLYSFLFRYPLDYYTNIQSLWIRSFNA